MMLSPDLFPVPLIHISETNSTNSYLQTFCAKEKTEEFTTVAADYQTSGRGQREIHGNRSRTKISFSALCFFPSFWKHAANFLFPKLCL